MPKNKIKHISPQIGAQYNRDNCRKAWQKEYSGDMGRKTEGLHQIVYEYVAKGWRVFSPKYKISHEQKPTGIIITPQKSTTGNLFTGSTQQWGKVYLWKSRKVGLMCMRKNYIQTKQSKWTALLLLFFILIVAVRPSTMSKNPYPTARSRRPLACTWAELLAIYR